MSAGDEASEKVEDLAREARQRATQAGQQVTDAASDAAQRAKTGQGIVNRLHLAGMRSEYAYVGAFASIGLSLASWLVSRAKPDDSKPQSDRWGIFIGHWAPTFMALGVALKIEEDNDR